MKTNSIWSLLINPFTRIAGWQAFAAGFVISVLSVWISSVNGTYFDGVIDFHYGGENYSLLKLFGILAIDIFSITAVMSLSGFIISKSFRLIDILGTMTFSRIPYLLLAVFSLFVKSPDLNEILHNPLSVFNNIGFVLVMILSLPVLVWYIALMYNALKVSCDVKGMKLNVVFIVAVIVAEVLSKILIYAFFR